jgi:amino acid transporter
MAPKGATVNEAKDLLSVVPFVWAILTAVLLGPAWRWSSEKEKYHRGRSVAAVVLSLLSTLLSVVVVVVMAPVGIKAIRNSGAVQGVLVLYEVILLAVIGATAWSLVVVLRAGRHLGDVMRD